MNNRPFFNCDEKSNHFKKINKITKKHKKMFEDMKHKMLNDKCLSLKGASAYGSFFRVTSQTLNVNDAVIFEKSYNVHNLKFTEGTSNIVVKQEGVYLLQFSVETNKADQITFFINGVPLATSTTGINKGAGQTYLRDLVDLKSGDVLTVENYISAIGTIITSQDAGGLQKDIQANFLVQRLGVLSTQLDPLCRIDQKPQCKVMYNPECSMYNYDKGMGLEYEESNESDKWRWLYNAFKHYMLREKDLMIEGSPAYFGALSSNVQTMAPEALAVYEINSKFSKNVMHRNCTAVMEICQDGVYGIAVVVQADQPAQYTIFINDVPNVYTTQGTDSGLEQVNLNQYLYLHSGDKLTVVNHTSAMNPINTSINAGGALVGTNNIISIIKIAQLPHKDKKHDDEEKGKKELTAIRKK